MHRYVLHNDEIREASAKILAPGQVGLLAGWGVFSTLRVHRGVLFAYERHFARMQRDAAALRVPFPQDPDYLRTRLHRLVEANAALEATLRVAVVRNGGGVWQGPVDRPFDLIGLTADLTDWGDSVRLTVQPQARHAACPLAGVKMLSWALNLAWLEQAQERGYDEVILLNERDEVSECTSANVFAVVGDRVQTPPLSSGCLPGVTRALLLEEIRVPGVTVEEKTLRLEDLLKADEVFITSSTRDLLPVREIEGVNLRRESSCRLALAEAFRRYLEEYTAAQLASR
ncbi:MAG: aminotransferase class IV [Bryobacterales bacterium]|nr:aminotransferase class IV [Bryobacteraceae bacterium]MDW8129694.1 aminotransferase class IV [Bryobacterales bacterium]